VIRNLGETDRPPIAVIDLGGTKCAVAVGFDRIEVCKSFATPDTLDETVEAIYKEVRTQLGERSLAGFGCAIAGELSEDRETIVRAGPLQERGWIGLPVKRKIVVKLGVEPDTVEMLNDAEAAALAELEDAKKQGLLVIPGFQALVETISSGNGGAVFDKNGAENVEPGHIDSGKKAPVICGCGKPNCIEAWISGKSVAKAWGVPMETVKDPDDSRWDRYLETLFEMQQIKLEALRGQGYDPKLWSLFGSVALKGPRMVVEDFRDRLAVVEPGITVKRARYGDKSGLYGAYFATQAKLAEAA
jgi:predicted NBD/HSP70 family sugar kinase